MTKDVAISESLCLSSTFVEPYAIFQTIWQLPHPISWLQGLTTRCLIALWIEPQHCRAFMRQQQFAVQCIGHWFHCSAASIAFGLGRSTKGFLLTIQGNGNVSLSSLIITQSYIFLKDFFNISCITSCINTFHWRFCCLTLKRLGYFFQNEILISNVVHHKCDIAIWNWSSTLNV